VQSLAVHSVGGLIGSPLSIAGKTVVWQATSRTDHMTDSNLRKRAAHRRRVQAALQQILNDPQVMPNVDCEDLVVSVSRVEFGHTVREIYIDVLGRWRHPVDPDAESPYQKYLRESCERGEEGVFDDLTDVLHSPHLTNVIAVELQHRLRLLYTPVIRLL
jgi:hypothetical protein